MAGAWVAAGAVEVAAGEAERARLRPLGDANTPRADDPTTFSSRASPAPPPARRVPSNGGGAAVVAERAVAAPPPTPQNPMWAAAERAGWPVAPQLATPVAATRRPAEPDVAEGATEAAVIEGAIRRQTWRLSEVGDVGAHDWLETFEAHENAQRLSEIVLR